MKKTFLEPELEVVKFEMEDILTGSPGTEEDLGGDTDTDFPEETADFAN